jgi:hypothetical protein
MANFLAKSKAGPSIPPARHREVAESTDFDRVFKPFALRKGVEVAPINHFDTPREGLKKNPIFVLDGEAPLLPSPAPVTRSPPVGLPGAIKISAARSTFTNTLCKIVFTTQYPHSQARALQGIGHNIMTPTSGILFARF